MFFGNGTTCKLRESTTVNIVFFWRSFEPFVRVNLLRSFVYFISYYYGNSYRNVYRKKWQWTQLTSSLRERSIAVSMFAVRRFVLYCTYRYIFRKLMTRMVQKKLNPPRITNKLHRATVVLKAADKSMFCVKYMQESEKQCCQLILNILCVTLYTMSVKYTKLQNGSNKCKWCFASARRFRLRLSSICK